MRLTQFPRHTGSRLRLCGLWDVSALTPSGDGMGLEEGVGAMVGVYSEAVEVIWGGVGPQAGFKMREKKKTGGFVTSAERDSRAYTAITAHLFH